MSYIGDLVPIPMVLPKTFAVMLELAMVAVGNMWFQ